MQGEGQDIFKPSFLGLFKNEENVVSLKAGELLFKKGEPAKSMYIVLSGELRIGDGNKIFEQLAPGGLVGEMALIDHAPRAATVTAVTECTLAAIDELCFSDPADAQLCAQCHARAQSASSPDGCVDQRLGCATGFLRCTMEPVRTCKKAGAASFLAN